MSNRAPGKGEQSACAIFIFLFFNRFGNYIRKQNVRDGSWGGYLGDADYP
jgi:hypothetical protein